MQNYRFSLSFIVTAFLYMLVGWMLLAFSTTLVSEAQKPKVQKMELSLSTFVSEPIPPVEELTPEKPEPEPVVEEIVEPVVEEQPKVEPKPEPIPERMIEKPIPKPIVKKQTPKKPNKKLKKKPRKKKPIKKHSVKKKVTHKKTKTKKHHKTNKNTQKRTTQASPAKKSAFLGAIRAKINKHKTYPRIAQRRGMQGVVKASFTIFANGKVGNIILGGKKVFYKSARKAIEHAFPISVKNAPLSLPTTVNVTLRYQMR